MLEIFTHLADAVAWGALGLEPGTRWGAAVHFFVEDTAKIFALLTALMLLMGFLRTWIAPERVRAWIAGKPRAAAYALALILGAITPFCSCSSIPLFIVFLSSGIPLGVTIAFLITSPMVNEVAAVLFGEAIGWHFTGLYVATGMGVGLVGGLLADALRLERWVEPFVFDVPPPPPADAPRPTLAERARQAWAEAKDILRRVWVYVLVGVGLGAGLHGFVPQDWFVAHAGPENLFAVPLAVIVAVPLYANVTGVVPVAEALIEKGLPVGTTLAFIMSTVAISLPELVILRKVLRPQMLAAFVAYIAVAPVAVGYAFNAIF
jgi:uncharacterized protein